LAHLITTGHAFLVLGALVGLSVTDAQLELMSPLLTPMAALVAGALGFSIGMRFHIRILRAIPRGASRVALTPGLGVAVITTGVAALILRAAGLAPLESLAAALVAAAAAAVASPTLAAAIRRRAGGRAPDVLASLRLIELSASLSNLLTLAAAVLAFSLMRAHHGGLAALGWVLCDLGLGLVTGAITWLFLGGPARRDERLLLGVGMITFTAGLAEWLALSPAALCAVAGATLVNLPGDRMASMAQTIRRLERPALVILMTLAGVYAVQDLHLAIIPLVLLLTVVRAGAAILLARRTTGALTPATGLASPHDWGRGLIPQGSLGLVCALAFRQVWPGDASEWVLAAIALAALLNEVAAPRILLPALSPAAPSAPPASHEALRT
jgi:hypothetical protein